MPDRLTDVALDAIQARCDVATRPLGSGNTMASPWYCDDISALLVELRQLREEHNILLHAVRPLREDRDHLAAQVRTDHADTDGLGVCLVCPDKPDGTRHPWPCAVLRDLDLEPEGDAP